MWCDWYKESESTRFGLHDAVFSLEERAAPEHTVAESKKHTCTHRRACTHTG